MAQYRSYIYLTVVFLLLLTTWGCSRHGSPGKGTNPADKTVGKRPCENAYKGYPFTLSNLRIRDHLIDVDVTCQPGFRENPVCPVRFMVFFVRKKGMDLTRLNHFSFSYGMYEKNIGGEQLFTSFYRNAKDKLSQADLWLGRPDKKNWADCHHLTMKLLVDKKVGYMVGKGYVYVAMVAGQINHGVFQVLSRPLVVPFDRNRPPWEAEKRKKKQEAERRKREQKAQQEKGGK